MELPGSLQLSRELIDIADIDIAQIDIDNFDIAEGIDLDSLSHHIDMTLTPAKAAEVDEFFAQWDDLDNLGEVLNLFKNSGTTIRKFFTRAKAVLNKTSDNAMDRLIADLGNTLYIGVDPAQIDEDLVEDIANYYLLQSRAVHSTDEILYLKCT